MDGELVSGSPSDNSAGGGGRIRPSPVLTYAEIFEREFPSYLAMGMSAAEFWDGDVALASGYRKAFEIKQEQDNYRLWMQGMYIYEALCCVAPIFRSFSKATKPIPYSTEPYPLNTRQSREQEEKRQRKNDAAAKAQMEAFMIAFNKRKKGG